MLFKSRENCSPRLFVSFRSVLRKVGFFSEKCEGLMFRRHLALHENLSGIFILVSVFRNIIFCTIKKTLDVRGVPQY